MDLVDTHAHLALPAFEDDLEQVLTRAERTGVRRIVSVGTDPESSRRCLELAARYPGHILATAGIHPSHWSQIEPGGMAYIEELARDPRIVAVGETGLDFHYDHPLPADQVEAFERHVALALAVGKPIIIHSRKADNAVLNVLRGAGGQLSGVRHCFDRPIGAALPYLEMGLYVSVGAAVTREGYRRLKAAVREIPAERLLLETDCPYQSPPSHAGQRNEPALIVETLNAAAALRGEPPDILAATTTANAERLFLRATSAP
jgi:TatD DNase family protein